jgi:hypothetical protein
MVAIEQRAHPRRSVGVQPRQHVAVRVERERDAGVAEQLLYDLRVDAMMGDAHAPSRLMEGKNAQAHDY